MMELPTMFTTLALTLATAASTASAAPASGESFGLFERLNLRAPAHTEVARDTDSMYMWLWWFCIAWFVFLMGLMVLFVLKYRRKPGQIAPVSSSHNARLEIAWTIIPTLMLVYIFFRGFEGFMEKVAPPGNAMELKLTGYKWSWDMEYPNGLVINRGVPGSSVVIGAEAAPVFYVPADVPIRLRMNSTDVMHAFWIPDFRVKADLVPNRYTAMWFKAKKPAEAGPGITVKRHPKSEAEAIANSLGDKMAPPFVPELAGIEYTDHWVFCAEYCGTSHSEMAAVIRVVPMEGYSRWLAATNDMIQNKLPPQQLGEMVFKGKCISCHSIDGSANTGPTWKNLYGHEVEFTDGTKYTAEQMSDPVFFANYVAESVRVPSAHIVKGYGNNMNAFSESQVSQKQLEALIEYMKSPALSDKAPPPAPGAPAEGEKK